MKLVLHAIRTNPNSIEELLMEDVASYTGDDNLITINFNDGTHEVVPLRSNDGELIHEWAGASIFVTRVGLKVDMSK